jgi:transposase
VDLAEQLDRWLVEQNKYQSLLRELLEAQRSRKSEQLTKEQLALFEAAWQAQNPARQSDEDDDEDDIDGSPQGGQRPDQTQPKKRSGRQALARHLVRERIVHDLAEAEKHCDCCGRDLRLIEEETSERYEYIPASVKVMEDVRRKYACECTIRTAGKPAQPIEKSTASASLLAQVIVAQWADHQPLHRQEKMFARHGVTISRKTMGGWMAQGAKLLDPLYRAMKKELFESKVIGTDDTSVKVLDPKLPFDRIGRIWPSVGDAHHPVIVYDYTPTRSRAGPAKFLEGYKGYLQADALFGLRRVLQRRTWNDRGRLLEARQKMRLQGVGIRPAYGSGTPSDCARVRGGGSRQRASAFAGAKTGAAEARFGPADGEAS